MPQAARKLVSGVAAAALAATTLLPGQARAGLVPTDAVIDHAEAGPHVGAEAQREQLRQFLDRAEVRRQMEAMGVNPDEAKARTEALSDAEVQRLAGQIETMPAGGDAVGAVIGAAVLIFIILLITDIAGLTDVFPFTKSARSR